MRYVLAALLVIANFAVQAAPTDAIVVGRDYHSFADTSAFRVKHLELDLQASFEEQRLSGVAETTAAAATEAAAAAEQAKQGKELEAKVQKDLDAANQAAADQRAAAEAQSQ